METRFDECNHAGGRKIELHRAIQIGKGETTEGIHYYYSDIPSLVLTNNHVSFSLNADEFLFAIYSTKVGRRGRS